MPGHLLQPCSDEAQLPSQGVLLLTAKGSHAPLLSAPPPSHESAPCSSCAQSITCLMTGQPLLTSLTTMWSAHCHLALVELPAAHFSHSWLHVLGGEAAYM